MGRIVEVLIPLFFPQLVPLANTVLTVPWSVTARMEAPAIDSAAVSVHLVGMDSIVKSQVKQE